LGWIKSRVDKLVVKHKSHDPFSIASNENIHVIPWNLHDDIQGFYKYIRRNQYIFLNSNLSALKQKFVCAHELGHAVIHPHSNTPFLRTNTLFSIDKIEVEANTFAVELLVSDERIKDYQTIREVASAYNIPDEVMHLKKF